MSAHILTPIQNINSHGAEITKMEVIVFYLVLQTIVNIYHFFKITELQESWRKMKIQCVSARWIQFNNKWMKACSKKKL